MKFRARSVELEAVQWFPGVEIAGVACNEGDRYAYLYTQFDRVLVMPGDWVVHAAQNYIIPDADIKARYVPV